MVLRDLLSAHVEGHLAAAIRCGAKEPEGEAKDFLVERRASIMETRNE